jgi:hypothetical protein
MLATTFIKTKPALGAQPDFNCLPPDGGEVRLYGGGGHRSHQ